MAAVRIIIALIPIVGIVMGSVLIFFYFLWRHKQIMRQIETNIYIRQTVDIYLFCLLLGVILTVTGCVLFGLFYLIAGVGYILLGGLIPLALGISLTVFYAITQRKRDTTKDASITLPHKKAE